jgi:AraC-like DNA-binding protein
MNFDLLDSLSPRIIDVVERERCFWETSEYRIFRARTRLHFLAYVCGGEGMFELNGVSYPLRTGCVFHSAPGHRQEVLTSRENVLHFYSIHFDYGILRWDGARGNWRDESMGLLPFPSTIQAHKSPLLRDVFVEALRVWNERKAGYDWYAKLCFMQTLGEVSKLLDTQNEQEDRSARTIKASTEYMKTHLGDPLDRETLARNVSLSPGYFSTLFRQHTGISPTRYVTKLRVDHAKDLLRNTDSSVRQISGDVGFADPFYFARVFRKETGLSPTEYRKA